MGPFWHEIRRRNIFRVGIAYLVLSWFILQLGDIVAPALDLPEWTLSFIIFLLVIGFPLVLFFAWAFEVTPEGLKRTTEVVPEISVTDVTGRKLNTVIFTVLGLVIAALLVDKFVVTPWRAEPGEIEVAATDGLVKASFDSIAVLPFVNMSGDAQQEYFSDGISEELLNLLAKNSELRVAARTSSFAFKGQNQDIKEIGNQLDVDTVLEGSVRKSGAQLRITAQLIETDTGYHLWSDTYDRELTDVFAIQDEISAAIVGALQVHLSGEPGAEPAKAQVTNLDAYNAYLKGRHKVEKREKSALYEALSNYDAAIAFDPTYAPAYSGKADTYLLLSDVSYGDIPQEQSNKLAQPVIERALELDPLLAEAHASKGLLLQQLEDYEGSVEALTRAIELAPNLTRAYVWRGNAYQSLGYKTLRTQDMEKAVKLDPFSLPGLSNLHGDYIAIGRYEAAAEIREQLKSVAGDQAYHYRLAEILWVFIQGHLAEVYTKSKVLKEDLDLPFAPTLTFSSLMLKNKDVTLSNAPFPREKFYFNLLFGDLDGAASALEDIKKDPEDVESGFALLAEVALLAAQGNEDSYEKAAALSAGLDESFGELLFENNPDDLNAPQIISIRMKGGDTEGANRLIEKLRTHMPEYESRGFDRSFNEVRAALKVFDGDLDGAMEVLEVMEEQHYLNWSMEKDPVFEPLRGREDFKAIFAELYVHINAERAKLGWDPVE